MQLIVLLLLQHKLNEKLFKHFAKQQEKVVLLLCLLVHHILIQMLMALLAIHYLDQMEDVKLELEENAQQEYVQKL